MKYINLMVIFSVACLSLLGCQQNGGDQRPNIVLILGDDIGFSDLGCYGSEIATPNLDRLASEGLRFTQFYNMAKCQTTRSVMLTGLYQGDSRAITLGEHLTNNGYTTIMCGKEHFHNWVPEDAYAENHYDHTFIFDIISEYFIPPSGEMSHPFRLNGKQLNVQDVYHEKEPFYKTDALTDHALKFLDTATQKDQPFFLYMAYNSAHYPLQARDEDIAKFRGKYLAGWDSLRQRRYERMIEMGIIEEKHVLSPPEGNINKFRGHPPGDEEIRDNIPLYRPWNSLSPEEQERLDLEMAVYAAMVHRLDINIGRIVTYLEENGLRDNTLIMYLSDNGSCPYDSNRDFDYPPGPAEGYRTLSAAWANLGNTPFRYFKQYGHEGGANTHFIASWPAKMRDYGHITHQPGHVADMVPTLLEITGIPYPDNVDGRPTIPLHGKSLLPVFMGEEREPPAYFVSGWTERFRMFRMDDWKIVKVNDGEWELYDMEKDRTEVNNLADERPEKVHILEQAYQQWKDTLP